MGFTSTSSATHFFSSDDRSAAALWRTRAATQSPATVARAFFASASDASASAASSWARVCSASMSSSSWAMDRPVASL